MICGDHSGSRLRVVEGMEQQWWYLWYQIGLLPSDIYGKFLVGKHQLKATCMLVNLDANCAGISVVIKFKKLRSVGSETKGRAEEVREL